METFYVTCGNWNEFLLAKAEEGEIFLSLPQQDHFEYFPLSENFLEKACFGVVRPAEPLKFFFFPFSQRILPSQNPSSFRILVGAAACDLEGLKVFDHVFSEGEYSDPDYLLRRNSALLISSDCSSPNRFCFCTAVGGKPYPTNGFDMNLSAIDEGYIVEIGTDRGRRFLGKDSRFLPSSPEMLAEREKKRARATLYVTENSQTFHIEDKIPLEKRISFTAKEWQSLWSYCVQCGSCTFSCPTCVCFLLEDYSGEKFVKVRTWDSCLLPGYAAMASGVSPRPLLTDRFKNRFMCKYSYMPQNFGHSGCTGCGRCIEGCAGKIDKRKVLQSVLTETLLDVRYES
ncbi:MAG: 4Fe-4S dicluster domain-containing protein [Candidatus Ratteibacteria bacterium]|jgi:ferredoxin